MNICSHLEKKFLFKIELAQALLKICGKDAQDFLQRMSTNDMTKLKNTNFLNNTFVNDKGKIIDRVAIEKKGDDEFLIYSSHDDPKILFDFLETYHFIEEFSLTMNSSGKQIFFISDEKLKSDNLFFNHQLTNQTSMYIYLADYDLAPSAQTISQEDFSQLKIASLVPSAPKEICLNYMPQNIGLAHLISDSKGCFIGQEVLAKALTYQKNPKKLGGLILQEEAYADLKLDEKIQIDDQWMAQISSKSPKFNNNFSSALAICKPSSANESGLKKFSHTQCQIIF